MADILQEVLKYIDKKKISDSAFEGANIILYTKDKEFFINNNGAIKKIVDTIKKRVELRPDPSICMDIEDAKETIDKLMPKDAGVGNVIFDPQRSIVIIEAEKPGLAIGKQGDLLREIRKQTFWVPLIKRTPALRSKLIETIRHVLYENNDYRKKFLNKVGKRIYGGWTKDKKQEWIRTSYLGGARQVGRSCVFLQTPESKVLLDCGVNIAADEKHAYPFLDAPEFKIDELDAVILTHAHLDHCLHPNSYVQLGDGTVTKIEDFYNQKRDDIKCLDIDDSLKIEDWKCFQKVKIPAPNKLYKIKTKSREITVTGEHPFFLLNNLKMIDKKAKEIKKGDFIATAKKIPFKGKRQELNDIIKIVDISEKGIEILKKERLRRGLKQIDIAKKIECKQSTISSIEKGNSLSLNLLRKLVKFYGLDEKFICRYSKKKENKSTKIKFPNKTSKELLQVLGYFIGDGHKVDRIVKGKRYARVEATDKDISNLKTYQKIMKGIFDLNGRITIKDRNRLRYNSPLLLDFINEISDKILCRSPYREIPELVHKVSKKEISGFLKGLYDAEGSVGDHHIVLTSTSENIIRITQMLLLRYNINSHIYDFKNPKSERKAYQLCIYNPDSIKSFKKEIGFDDGNKKIKLDKLCGKVGNACAERIDLIPLEHDKLIEISEKLKLRKVDLRNLGINYQHYLKHNISRRKLKQVLEIFNNRAKKLSVELSELKNINKLVNSDIVWDPIQSIEEVKSDCDFVYDMKVAGHHNYIANGIIVHNCGLIPWLYKMGYKGPLYCTLPTRDVSALLNLDYIGVAQKEAKKGLFSAKDVKEMVKHTIDLNYGEVTDITPDIRITLYNAGHTLGSSLVHMHIGNGLHNFMYTGDFKYLRTQLLEPAVTSFPRLETVLMEATYGGKDCIVESKKKSEEKLISIIKETIENKGKVLIPVLGVGRSQEVMLILEKAIREGALEKIPIYVQGMVWDVTAIHTAYPDFLNKNVRRNIFHKDNNPFLSDVFIKVTSRKEQEQIMKEKGSCIIMATSGMMTAGASVSYFKEMSDNPKNTIVFTCYQAEGSLGKRIQTGEKSILLAGEKHSMNVKLRVESIPGLTGHSDRNELVRYSYDLDPKPKKIIVMHGESSRCLDLASSLHKIHKIETSAPKNLEAIRIR